MFRLTRPRFAVVPESAMIACLAVALAAAATPAAAGVNWHPDLAAARAASAKSQKPVLAVFTAKWSPESTRFADHTLTSAEATALITACFEAVLIDVDAQPDITKRLRVAHVPSACVVAGNDVPLAAFDCPEPPPEFVAAAARAAQDAAVVTAATAAPTQVERAAPAALSPSRAATDLASVGFAGSAPTTDAGPLPGHEQAQSGKGSISLVTAKVRQLSTFANGSQPSAAGGIAAGAATAIVPGNGSSSAPVAAPLDAHTNANRLVVATSAEPPALPRTPPAWPAESATASSAFTSAVLPQPPTRQSIEPVQATSVTTAAVPTTASAPWIAQPSATPQAAPQAPATAPNSAPPTEPDSSAVVSDIPEKATKRSAWSSFVAAVQTPFLVFSKPATKPEAPPTLSPARPTSPIAPPASSPNASVAQAAPPATTPPVSAPPAAAAQPFTATAAASAPPLSAAPDTYGSMPLGLEGYCPVTLADRGVWTEGRAQWGVRHRGRTYLFAGPEQQEAFLTNPDRYAPALSGDDPVLAFDQGRAAPGRRAYGVTYQSRMYLFSSPETKAAFTANPDRYTTSVVIAERPMPSGDVTRRY